MKSLYSSVTAPAAVTGLSSIIGFEEIKMVFD